MMLYKGHVSMKFDNDLTQMHCFLCNFKAEYVVLERNVNTCQSYQECRFSNSNSNSIDIVLEK